MSAERQRIDRWLWHARIVRTRLAAASLAAAGHVRVNGVRVTAPSRAVKCDDVVTIALDGGVRVVKVSGFSSRRSDAAATVGLYTELTEGDRPRH